MSFPTAHRQPASDTASIQSRSNSRRMASHSRTNSAGALPRGRYGRADGTRDAPAAILLHLLAKAAQRTIEDSLKLSRAPKLTKLSRGPKFTLAFPPAFRGGPFCRLCNARSRVNVRFGSLADIGQLIRDVRFAPESRHVQRRNRCLLSATSRHSPSNVAALISRARWLPFSIRPPL